MDIPTILISIGVLYLIVGLVLGLLAFWWGYTEPYREYSLWRLAFGAGLLIVGWLPLNIYRRSKGRADA